MLPRAVAIAAEFAALPGDPLRHTRRQVRAPALDLIARQRADDELVRQMPEGVYLKALTQKELRVNLVGYAQSNARVSTLMRNIESSPWMERPELVEVKASTVDKRRVSEFNLNLSLKRAAAKEAGAKDSGKAPAKDAAKKG